ncbi:uncharacterized protein LOC131543795 [Onychostoma macrolepis]|uniref:uncharacterized protein LOC131543795 n=1 Tax=Onychostoma macrolepis TaxID=369639 RepID=UPI00272BCAB6|nr:uncharacterized protein LOC131543795 [Onychostoma macrolepis]
MADNYDVDETQLTVCEDDDGLNGVHNDDDNLVIITAEDVQREIVGAKLRHESANVTTTAPSHTECSDEQLHTPTVRANAHTDVIDPSTQRMYGCGQAVKRVRLSEQETSDSPSTRRLRTSENNEQDHDQRGLTAWSDSLVHAWDQVSFTDTESEEEEEEEEEVEERFLTIVKQGDLESGTLTLTLPKQDNVHTDAPASTPANAPDPPSNKGDEEDHIVNEILNNILESLCLKDV